MFQCVRPFEDKRSYVLSRSREPRMSLTQQSPLETKAETEKTLQETTVVENKQKGREMLNPSYRRKERLYFSFQKQMRR